MEVQKIRWDTSLLAYRVKNELPKLPELTTKPLAERLRKDPIPEKIQIPKKDFEIITSSLKRRIDTLRDIVDFSRSSLHGFLARRRDHCVLYPKLPPAVKVLISFFSPKLPPRVKRHRPLNIVILNQLLDHIPFKKYFWETLLLLFQDECPYDEDILNVFTQYFASNPPTKRPLYILNMLFTQLTGNPLFPMLAKELGVNMKGETLYFQQKNQNGNIFDYIFIAMSAGISMHMARWFLNYSHSYLERLYLEVLGYIPKVEIIEK